jgi:hypothetical protein
MAAWEKVRPASHEYPNNIETNEDLPDLYPGDSAVISLTYAVVTIKKTYLRNKKLRQESITVNGQPDQNWVKILPRDNLKNRFFVLERSSKKGTVKHHTVANRDRVEAWLKYLFADHREYKRRLESGELEISTVALESLERQSELASVDTTDCEEDTTPDPATEFAMIQPAVESGFIDHHLLALDKFPSLYFKKDFLKIKQSGKIEIIQEQCQLRPIYAASANLAFPLLFTHGQPSPTDFGRTRLPKIF